MNLNKVGNNFCFTDITIDDIKFSNLRGAETRSVFSNSDNPGHTINIWLTDDMANILRAEGAYVLDKVVDTDGSPVVKHSIKLNVFASVLQSFKVCCGDYSEKMQFESLGLVDDSRRIDNIEKLNIGFHLYPNKYKTISTSVTHIWLYVKDRDKIYAAGSGGSSSEDVEKYFAGLDRGGASDEVPFV